MLLGRIDGGDLGDGAREGPQGGSQLSLGVGHLPGRTQGTALAIMGVGGDPEPDGSGVGLVRGCEEPGKPRRASRGALSETFA